MSPSCRRWAAGEARSPASAACLSARQAAEPAPSPQASTLDSTWSCMPWGSAAPAKGKQTLSLQATWQPGRHASANAKPQRRCALVAGSFST